MYMFTATLYNVTDVLFVTCFTKNLIMSGVPAVVSATQTCYRSVK